MGNILATITDAKIYQTNGCLAKVVSGSDYYAFGAAMPSRSYQDAGYTKYRYGFNGKENDDDFQDYGMRIYCPECGVFLSVDPIAAKYPELSTYQFASRNPIGAVDLDGLEADKDFNAPNFSVSKMWGDLWKNLSWSPANATNQQELQKGAEKQKYAAQQVENATFVINELNEGMTTVMSSYFSFLPVSGIGASMGLGKLSLNIGRNTLGKLPRLKLGNFNLANLNPFRKPNIVDGITSFGVEAASQYTSSVATDGFNFDYKQMDVADMLIKLPRFKLWVDVGLGTVYDFTLQKGLTFITDKTVTEIGADIFTKTISISGHTNSNVAPELFYPKPDFLGLNFIRNSMTKPTLFDGFCHIFSQIGHRQIFLE